MYQLADERESDSKPARVLPERVKGHTDYHSYRTVNNHESVWINKQKSQVVDNSVILCRVIRCCFVLKASKISIRQHLTVSSSILVAQMHLEENKHPSKFKQKLEMAGIVVQQDRPLHRLSTSHM